MINNCARKKINYCFKNRTNLICFVFLLIIIFIISLFLFKQSQNREDYYPLNSVIDLEPLISRAAQANFVLLGEASHGTSEYYLWRAHISRELIEKHNFDFILIEGDWSAIYQLNLYVRHLISPENGAEDIMRSFSRWPTWMWANEEFLSFVEWLRDYNKNLDEDKRVGLYGKDIYGAHDSMFLVLDYLDSVDKNLAIEAQNNYQCLLDYAGDFQAYVRDLSAGEDSCQLDLEIVSDLLLENKKSLSLLGEKEYFNAQQNALVAIYAEKHYRNNLSFGPHAWNARVLGMEQVFNNLITTKSKNLNKGIIWAHNTHIGDARATDMKEVGMLNIGQLLRERFGKEDVFAVGFTSYRGTLIAGSSWGEPGQILIMPPAQPNSLESFLAEYTKDDGLRDFYIIFENNDKIFNQFWGHRAKGVVYQPAHDYRQYVETIPAQRYDAFIFIYQSKALNPL